VPPTDPPASPPFRDRRVHQSVVVQNVLHWRVKGDDTYQEADVKVQLQWFTDKEFTNAYDTLQAAAEQYFTTNNYTFKRAADLYSVYSTLKRHMVAALKEIFGSTEVFKITKVTLTDSDGRIYER